MSFISDYYDLNKTTVKGNSNISGAIKNPE